MNEEQLKFILAWFAILTVIAFIIMVGLVDDIGVERNLEPLRKIHK